MKRLPGVVRDGLYLEIEELAGITEQVAGGRQMDIGIAEPGGGQGEVFDDGV